MKRFGSLLRRIGVRLDFYRRSWMQDPVPTKVELKEAQRHVCDEYLADRPELAEKMPVELAQKHALLMGSKATVPEPNSRSVSILRMRFVRTIEFAFAATQREILSQEISVLDAGAADGLYLQALSKSGIGLNVDENCVMQMREEGILAEQGSIYQMPFESKKFDYSLCLEVLEHIQDPIRALNELRRVTRKALIVSIPQVNWTRIRAFGYWSKETQLKSFEELRKEAHHYHLFEFCIDDFEKVCGHAGWRIDEKEHLIPFSPLPKFWLILLRPIWN